VNSCQGDLLNITNKIFGTYMASHSSDKGKKSLLPCDISGCENPTDITYYSYKPTNNLCSFHYQEFIIEERKRLDRK
jgi:hypothetical protein